MVTRFHMACAAPITTSSPVGNIQVRCKQCLNCRIYKQSALTLRCLLENATSLSAQFWTLTYADAPEIGDYGDFKSFLKRYRQWNRRRGNLSQIRYLGCGEYGSKSGRFHYHALIFNALHPDQDRSLTRLWPHGFVKIGTVTPASVRYTARYTLKFEAKGRESVAGWSQKPPLGSDGIKQVAAYMRANAYQLESAPTTCTISGKTYPMDRAMQIEFAEEFNPDWVSRHPDTGQRFLTKTSPLVAHHAYVEYHKLGDPIAQQRRRQLDRNTFFETARFTNERL